MADKEHVALLKQGVEVWNKWREESPEVTPALMNADLSSANLYRANLSGADLNLANLSAANLSAANLSGVDLGGANLTLAKLWCANLSDANLSGANLSDANLSKANLNLANLSGADLNLANLSKANLSEANLSGANLSGANLTLANLSGADLNLANLSSADLNLTDLSEANLSGADLTYANLSDTDLQQATLIDSDFNSANLTGAKLWETQRGGWSIKGVICQRAFWDRDGEEAVEYKDGDFERIFADRPRIVLRYTGGMSPVDLAMLPLIIERLQVEHPNNALHIRSVQDDGSGATVTITVEDLAGRSTEDFAQDMEVLRVDLVMVQQRLQQEERLRLQAEASYRTMVQDVLPELLERALPKTEVHVGQITGPTIIEGTAVSRDTYNIHGQAGAVGKNAHAHDMSFRQAWNQSNIDLPTLAKELGQLRAAMKEADGKDNQDEAIGAVAAAEKAAVKGDGPTTLQHLKAAGKWALGVAEKIGVTVATEAIKQAM